MDQPTETPAPELATRAELDAAVEKLTKWLGDELLKFSQNVSTAIDASIPTMAKIDELRALVEDLRAEVAREHGPLSSAERTRAVQLTVDPAVAVDKAAE
jgi:hypothetical protein